jgi:arsenical pump membrane protein
VLQLPINHLTPLANAAAQIWPAFVLVTGLLLVGVVAEQDGLFHAAGSLLARLPVGSRTIFAIALVVVALVTAVLNLDTSVFFLTPVLLHLARARALDEAPFLYGAVFMSNAASLVLPGSNLTNLIVLHGEHASGAVFFGRMWPAAFASVLTTIAVLLVAFRRSFGEPAAPVAEPHEARIGVGAVAVLVSASFVLALSSPALPVLVVGIAAIVVTRTARARVLAAVDVRILGLLFVLATALGGLGRWWGGADAFFDSLARWQVSGLAAAAAVGFNNLPAAVLLTPDPPLHARALLLGLNIGPNLAVTGSLSALLWLRVARSLGAHPSAKTYSRIGVVLAPLTLAAALAALWLVAPGRV